MEGGQINTVCNGKFNVHLLTHVLGSDTNPGTVCATSLTKRSAGSTDSWGHSPLKSSGPEEMLVLLGLLRVSGWHLKGEQVTRCACARKEGEHGDKNL